MTTARATYHAGLSRDQVVAAAVEMLLAEGLGAFSLRRLAARLGVDPMALYKHVRNKDDLLAAAVALALRDAHPDGSGEWWEQAAHTLREHRRVVRANPWLLAVLLTQQRLDSAEPWVGVEETIALLEEHLGAAGAARWIRLLVGFTNGFLLTEPDLMGTAGSEKSLEASSPRVAAAAARGAGTSDEDFETGLGVLVAAMRAEAERR